MDSAALNRHSAIFDEPELPVTTQRGVPVPREQNIALVESYLACFASKDPADVPFADGVVFEGPTWPTLTGRQAVVSFLRLILPGIRRAQIKRHIVEGDHIATIFDMETDQGVEHVCDCIEIANGKITRVEAFFYPRPIAPGDREATRARTIP